MPQEDEIDRIVNRVRNSPRKPFSDQEIAYMLEDNAKHVRFYEAKVMKMAAARLQELHAVLTAEPADDDEVLRIAWLKEKLRALGHNSQLHGVSLSLTSDRDRIEPSRANRACSPRYARARPGQ
jgi:hypothetical protein